jgi:hypothetical protein
VNVLFWRREPNALGDLLRALFGNVTEPDRALRTFVRDRLAEGWTPEQISGWLKRGNERRCVLGEVSAFSWSNWGALPDKASGSRGVARGASASSGECGGS